MQAMCETSTGPEKMKRRPIPSSGWKRVDNDDDDDYNNIWFFILIFESKIYGIKQLFRFGRGIILSY